MKISGKLLERKTGGRSRYWQVFWLCFAVAAALFLPHCIIDGLNGDFSTTPGTLTTSRFPFIPMPTILLSRGAVSAGQRTWAAGL